MASLFFSVEAEILQGYLPKLEGKAMIGSRQLFDLTRPASNHQSAPYSLLKLFFGLLREALFDVVFLFPVMGSPLF